MHKTLTPNALDTDTDTEAFTPPLLTAITSSLTPLQRAQAARNAYQDAAHAAVEAAERYRSAVQDYVTSARANGISQRKAASILGITEATLRDMTAPARRPR